MFSVVIPLYNKEKSIQRTLDSVLKQTFKNFEVLVINDGSTDESAQRVNEISDSRIKLIQKENGGVCSARNKGISLAKYKFIALLDADDLWEPDYLQEQSLLIHDFPDAAMWGVGYGQLVNSLKINVDHVLPKAYRNYVTNYFTLHRKTDLFHASAVVINKEVFKKIDPFDERIKYAEDLDVWYRILINHPVVFYNAPLTYYNLDAENRVLNQKIRLKDYLPYYIDKYNDSVSFKHNIDFLRYINNWAAVKISEYYFNQNPDRNDAKVAIKKLDYSLIKWKYMAFYKTPFIIGYAVFNMIKCKKRLFKRINGLLKK